MCEVLSRITKHMSIISAWDRLVILTSQDLSSRYLSAPSPHTPASRSRAHDYVCVIPSFLITPRRQAFCHSAIHLSHSAIFFSFRHSHNTPSAIHRITLSAISYNTPSHIMSFATHLPPFAAHHPRFPTPRQCTARGMLQPATMWFCNWHAAELQPLAPIATFGDVFCWNHKRGL